MLVHDILYKSLGNENSGIFIKAEIINTTHPIKECNWKVWKEISH